MDPIRTHLYSSTYWSVCRPKFPLTQGHFILRLNDPAIAFEASSAADLLHCYGHLRRAVTAITGATAAQLYIALNWQPVGDSIGEPSAETSTPTLHAFFDLPGSTTAASSLRLPAHQRAAMEDTSGLDTELRAWHSGLVSDGPVAEPATGLDPAGLDPAELDLAQALPAQARPGDPAPGEDRSWEPEGWEERAFHLEPVFPHAGEPFRGGHWTAIPRFLAATLDGTSPESLLSLVNTMEGLASHSLPPFQGITVWVTDEWGSPATAPAIIHIFARQHGDERSQVADFVAEGGLDLPLALPLDRELQGNSGDSSPTVEK